MINDALLISAPKPAQSTFVPKMPCLTIVRPIVPVRNIAIDTEAHIIELSSANGRGHPLFWVAVPGDERSMCPYTFALVAVVGGDHDVALCAELVDCIPISRMALLAREGVVCSAKGRQHGEEDSWSELHRGKLCPVPGMSVVLEEAEVALLVGDAIWQDV